MSAQPPPGYDPNVSKLVGADSSVPIIKMSGGGAEPPQNYIDGGYKDSMLNGTVVNAPIERQSGGADFTPNQRLGVQTLSQALPGEDMLSPHPSAEDDGLSPHSSMSGGGKELLYQLQITEEEFADLAIQDLSFADFTTKLESCNGPQDLEGANCEAVRNALKTIFINRLKSYIDECKGFTAGEGEVLAPELGIAAGRVAGEALPEKLIYDQSKKVWRAPKAFESDAAALAPEKGQWIPKGDGTWVPAKPSTERGAPGSTAGPKYMKEFPKGSGTFVPATQADVGAVEVAPGKEWKKVVSKSVFGTKETWLPPETEEAAAKRLEAVAAAEEAGKIKSKEALAITGEILGAPTVEAKAYPSEQEAAANYAKIKVLFDLINFLPTIYKGIPQPNTQTYEYNTLSELIRATAAIFANIMPSMRTADRTKELETFKISTKFPNLTRTIGTSVVMDKGAKDRILGFINAHQDVFKISSVTDVEIIESIYTQLLNFIGDIGNLTLYNRLRADSSKSTPVDNFAETLFPKLTDPSFFSSEGKANYISIFYQNPNPASMPAEQYGTTVFAYRTGMPYVSKDLVKTAIPVQIAPLLAKTMPVKIDTFNFNYLMRRFFSNYGPIKEEDEKLFDLIHENIGGFDMIFNLFVKHDANPFSSFADAASPEGKFAPDKPLDDHYIDAINRFSKLLAEPIMSGIVDPGNLFGTNDDDIFSKLLPRVKDASVNPGFTFDQYVQGFDAIFNVLDDAFVTRGAANERPVSDEGQAKYKTHLEDFMIICEFLTSFMEPEDDASSAKTMYQTVFGRIYNYYIRMYAEHISPSLALINVPGGDPAATLSAKQVNKMQLYFKKVYGASPYYIGNIFDKIMKRYLANNKNILSVLPDGTDRITAEKDLYAWLLHFRTLISTPGSPLNRICTAAGTPPNVRGAYNEIVADAIEEDDFIAEFRRNPMTKKVFLDIIFDHIKKNSEKDDSILTSADIKYINDIKDTLNMTKYTKAVKNMFYIHASLKKKYGAEYKYGHKPIDKFFDDAVIRQLNNRDNFKDHTFDAMMLLDQLNENDKMDEDQTELYVKSREIMLQFMQPYLEQSYIDFYGKIQAFLQNLAANRNDIINNIINDNTITDPMYAFVDATIPQIDQKINDLNLANAQGVSGLTAEISNFINDADERQNIHLQIATLQQDIKSNTIALKSTAPYDLQRKEIQSYHVLFVNSLINDIKNMITTLRDEYINNQYSNQDQPESDVILKAFYKVSETDDQWTTSTWNKLLANPSDMTFIKYFVTMNQLDLAGILGPPANLIFRIVNSFFQPAIAFAASQYVGEKPEKDDQADDADDEDRLNAFEVNGLKFIEYPADILYGAPDTPERKNFIELIIALLTKLLSLIFMDPKKAKERIKPFFYLLNQFELLLYSIGEQENKNYVEFKALFGIDSINSFIKLAYEQYYKDTRLPGKDFNGFDAKKVIKAIGPGAWVTYPYQKDIKTWFGGSADNTDLEVDMKGGFFGDPLMTLGYAAGGLASMYLGSKIRPIREGTSTLGNWITGLFGAKTVAPEPITPDMTIVDVKARSSSEIAGAFKTTFYDRPSLLVAIQKKLLMSDEYLGYKTVKGMMFKLNSMNTPVDILGDQFYTQYPNVNNYIGKGTDITSFNWATFDTYIQSLFPNLSENKFSDTILGKIGNYLIGQTPGDTDTAQFKKDQLVEFIKSLDAVISKFTKYYKDQIKAYNVAIRQAEKQIFDARQSDPTEGREATIVLIQEKITDLRNKKQLCASKLNTLRDLHNNVFAKMRNIMTSTFSNYQFPSLAVPGPIGMFDIPSIPPTDPAVAGLRIGMKDPMWKDYAIDAILFLQNAYIQLIKRNKTLIRRVIPGLEQIDLIVPGDDSIFSLKGDARENAIKTRFDKLALNFVQNNILNIDKDLSIFVNTWSKLIAGEGSKNALLGDTDTPLSIFSKYLPSTKELDAFFCSLQSYRIYTNTNNNAINARNLVIEYVKFMKAIFNHFKELVCILGDGDVQKNELLAPFSTNPIVTYMKLNPINVQKKEKGKNKPLSEDEKKAVGNKLNKCFEYFLASPDPSQFGELFSVLYYITKDPQNAKLKKAFDGKKAKFELAYKVLKAYCDLEEDFVPPPSYGLPTVYIPGPPAQRLRYKMFDQPEVAVKKYTMTGVSNQEFIANRQVFNLLYDSIYSRKKFYDRHLKFINDRKNKAAGTNIKFPKVDQIETGTRDELKFLASVLYSYGLKARTEVLERIREGTPEEQIVKEFAGYSFTAGEGLDFSDQDIKELAARIDITRLDIQAPPYMFLTPGQRTFACERAMRKIHELKYEQVLMLLITLLGSYETQEIDKDDIVDEVNKKMVVKPITDIDANTLGHLRTASLVVRYDGLANNFVDDGVEYRIKGILQVPENYTCFLNGKYGKIAPVKLFSDVDDVELRKELEEEDADVEAILAVAEETSDGDSIFAPASEPAAAPNAGLVAAPVPVAPNQGLAQAGGNNDSFIVRNRTRSGSNSQYRLTASRKHVNREHNKHTRKNK